MAAGSERDAGFCSGGDEDDNMSGLHSPSASEDSVEVQVTPISLRNKRKLAEPRKIQEPNTAPLKKRRFEQIDRTIVATTTNTMDSVVQDEESRPAGSPSPSPFRPWSSPAPPKNHTNNNNINNNNNNNEMIKSSERILPIQEETDSQEGSIVSLKRHEKQTPRRHDEIRWIEEENKRREEESQRRYEARIQEEVLSRLQESDNRHYRQRPLSPVSPQLLLASSSSSSSVHSGQSSSQRRTSRQQQRFEPPPPPQLTNAAPIMPHPRLQDEPLSLVLRGENARVPDHPAVNGYERPSPTYNNGDHLLHSSHNQNDEIHINAINDHSRHHETSQGQQQQQQQQQRNYKNMTRERRIEANARERTRVHTISAAFDTLRRAIPAYSHNQKLSKLSVLRIACSYIMTLSNIANTPEGEPTTSPSLGACVDLVSRTIQTEGKLRKKKDE